MIRLYLSLLLLLFFPAALSGQSIHDVRAEAQDAEGRIIEIYYTLVDDIDVPTTYKVDLYGVYGDVKRLLFRVDGEVGDSIRVGTNKITWYADQEFPRFKGNISFEVRAVRNFMILKPDAGVVMKRGKNYTFEWFGEGSTTDDLTLLLYQYNTLEDTIATSVGKTRYTWKIPKKTPIGDGYQIRIQGTPATNIDAFSRSFEIRRNIPLIVQVGSAMAAAGTAAFFIFVKPPTEPDSPLPEPPALPE